MSTYQHKPFKAFQANQSCLPSMKSVDRTPHPHQCLPSMPSGVDLVCFPFMILYVLAQSTKASSADLAV